VRVHQPSVSRTYAVACKLGQSSAGDNRGAQLEVGRGKTRQVFILLHIAPDHEKHANRQVSLAIQADKSMRATTKGASTSIWLATATVPDFPVLTADTQTDVCVIGAGIAGLTSAYPLCRVGSVRRN
jgi:hypothetical protein